MSDDYTDGPQGAAIARAKEEIIVALSHPEAEEGLYFRNLFHLHEEDERPVVQGDESVIFDALGALVNDGMVDMKGSGTDTVFILKRRG